MYSRSASVRGLVKKCASCTKDLPEAALHCVFCGAKQPPAPAVQPGLAKTAFGYSNEMMEQLRQPPVTAQRRRRRCRRCRGRPVSAADSAGAATAPSQPPCARARRRRRRSRATRRRCSSTTVPPADVAAAACPPADVQQTLPRRRSSTALQATLAAPPQPQQNPPPLAPMRPAAVAAAVRGGPVMRTTIRRRRRRSSACRRTATRRWRSRSRAAPGDRAVDPWRDSFKLVMIVWGVLMLVAFATPISDRSARCSRGTRCSTARASRASRSRSWPGSACSVVIAADADAAAAARRARGVARARRDRGADRAQRRRPEWHSSSCSAAILLIVPGAAHARELHRLELPRILVTLGVFVRARAVRSCPSTARSARRLVQGADRRAGQAKVVPILAGREASCSW